MMWCDGASHRLVISPSCLRDERNFSGCHSLIERTACNGAGINGGDIMSSIADKVKGTGNEIAGKAKQAVGKATDDDRLRAEGAGQEAKGKIQKNVGKAKDAVKDAIDDL
jgi:uncharacterized protein YjbJ (UPF0337 family)